MYRMGLASLVGSRTEWFVGQALDANGEIAVTLSQTPKAGARVAVAIQEDRRAAHVVSVSGKTVTVRVVKLATPTLAHAPTTGGCGAAGCSANSVKTVPDHSGANLPVAASETVDFAVIYEPA